MTRTKEPGREDEIGSWASGAERVLCQYCPSDQWSIYAFKHIVTPGLGLIFPLFWHTYVLLSYTISLVQGDFVTT